MPKLLQSPVQALQALASRLSHELGCAVYVVFEYGDFDALRVWIVSGIFDNLGDGQRRARTKSAVATLPNEVRLRITLLFQVTPEEFTRRYSVHLDDLDEAVNEAGHDGPFVIRAQAA